MLLCNENARKVRNFKILKFSISLSWKLPSTIEIITKNYIFFFFFITRDNFPLGMFEALFWLFRITTRKLNEISEKRVFGRIAEVVRRVKSGVTLPPEKAFEEKWNAHPFRSSAESITKCSENSPSVALRSKRNSSRVASQKRIRKLSKDAARSCAWYGVIVKSRDPKW